MAFLTTSARPRLRVLARSADPISLFTQLEVPRPRRIATGKLRPSPPPPARRRFEPTLSPDAPTKPQPNALARRPTNNQIPFSHVYLLDPATQKRSATKHSLEALLARHVHARTPDRQVLELVASTPDPIVRVTTRAEIEARYKALKRGARVGDASKEVQLTWGVARGDVEHKLRKAARDLDKGYRVVVVITVKHTRRPSNRQELVAFADEVAEVLSETGEECKEREITGRSMVLSFRKVGASEDVS